VRFSITKFDSIDLLIFIFKLAVLSILISILFCYYLLSKVSKIKSIIKNKVRGNIYVIVFINIFYIYISFRILVWISKISLEPINEILLGNFQNVNLALLLINFTISYVFIYIFITSLNNFLFRYFDVPNSISIRNNVIVFNILVIILFFSIHMAKYLSIVMGYIGRIYFNYHINLNDYLINILLSLFSQKMISTPNIPITPSTSEIAFLFKIISIIIIFSLYIIYILIKYPFKLNRIIKNTIIKIDKKLSKKNKTHKIKKGFFSNQSKARHFYKYYLLFDFSIMIIYSILITYYLVKQTLFNDKSFILVIFQNYLSIFIFVSILKILGAKSREVQMLHKFKVSDFINKDFLRLYYDYLLNYLSIGSSLMFTIAATSSYDILKNYENIIVPKEYQTIQVMILLFISSYISLIFAKITQESWVKKIEEGEI